MPPIYSTEPIPIPDPISNPNPIPKPILIPEQIPKPIPEPIAETDSGPTIRNRFQKISELTRIDSYENFIFPITTLYQHLCTPTSLSFVSSHLSFFFALHVSCLFVQWNISDYFNQNQEKLSQTVCDDMSVLPDFPGTLNMPHFDRLWMCLYARLGDLCVDPRPAVRKSAGQTLFSTISAHGALLNPPTWQAVLWQVLFPLLDKVRALSSCASNEKVDTSGNILIHHSRNTAQKQWAETQVLTLSGVSRVSRRAV